MYNCQFEDSCLISPAKVDYAQGPLIGTYHNLFRVSGLLPHHPTACPTLKPTLTQTEAGHQHLLFFAK